MATVSLVQMRTTYTRIQLYRKRDGAVRAAEHFMSRTQDLQTSTLTMDRSLAEVEKLLSKVETTAVRDYASTAKRICEAFDDATPLAEKDAQCLASACSDLPHLQDLLSSRGMQNGEAVVRPGKQWGGRGGGMGSKGGSGEAGYARVSMWEALG